MVFAFDTSIAVHTLLETAVENGSFRTLVSGIKAVGLMDKLSRGGPYTLFAPNDEAFRRLSTETLDLMRKDKGLLTKVITYHIVGGIFTAYDLKKARSKKTLEGKNIAIASSGMGILVNHAAITIPDIECSNGIMHIIDAVLIPPV
jgi:uncharacterized surface protein with fasciclin (FAS1) repeats